MTKVKRYHLTETGLVEGESLGRLSVVLAADYDAAVEQIAQLEQLNVLGQETVTLGLNTSARLVAERDALQQRLTAADEREDAAIALVTRMIECAGGQPSIATGYLRDILDALNSVEGGGDEAI